MKRFLTFLLLSGSIACSKSNEGGSDGPKPGVVTGHVVDTYGKPLANATIIASHTEFYNKNVIGTTDAGGNYRLELSPGTWYVRGSKNVTFEGKAFRMDLFTEDDGPVSATAGAVKNLRLKLSGPRTGNFGDEGYYGGTVEIFGGNEFYDYTNTEITLEPVGTLIDGSTGKTIVSRLQRGLYVEDVPIGKYKVTAKYLADNSPLFVRMRLNGTYEKSVLASFENTTPGTTRLGYKMNIQVAQTRE